METLKEVWSMEDSIFKTIKKLIGTSESNTYFDVDIVTGINTTLMILNRLGIGPKGFKITGESETWGELLSDNNALEGVKTYIQLNVKLIVDPPLNSTVVDCMKQMIKELEWRLNEIAESNL
jgi:hypothetical protein